MCVYVYFFFRQQSQSISFVRRAKQLIRVNRFVFGANAIDYLMTVTTETVVRHRTANVERAHSSNIRRSIVDTGAVQILSLHS